MPDPSIAPTSPQTTAGLRVRPFRAVRYTSAAHPDLGPVTAPPYDMIDEVERVGLEATDEHNVVRLILPREPSTEATEVDAKETAPEETGADRYTSAATLYQQWLENGVLAFDEQPALYPYRQSRDGVLLQSGIFVTVGLEPLDSGIIIPHENVRPGPVEDRLDLMRAMQANPEPIVLLYDGGGRTTEICADSTSLPPLRSTTTPDGIHHELWAITEPESLVDIQTDLSTCIALIADGHHRYTTYHYLAAELTQLSSQREATTAYPSAPWDFGLALLIDRSVVNPDIQAIHRVVPNLSLDDAVRLATPAFRSIRTMPTANIETLLETLHTTAGHAFAVTNGETSVILADPDADLLERARPTDRSAPWWALDASIASAFVLADLWGVHDVAGVLEAEHDPVAAIRIARNLDGVALLLKPPPLDDIMAVAVAGDTMPRKSTLFGPKPRSGILLRSLEAGPRLTPKIDG